MSALCPRRRCRCCVQDIDVISPKDFAPRGCWNPQICHFGHWAQSIMSLDGAAFVEVWGEAIELRESHRVAGIRVGVVSV